MSEESRIPTKRVSVNHVYPESLETKVPNHFVIQHDEETFTLSFFEIRQPIILEGNNSEKLAQLEALTEVDAKCVARLVLTPSRMYNFIAAVQENFEKFESKTSFFDDAEESKNNESE